MLSAFTLFLYNIIIYYAIFVHHRLLQYFLMARYIYIMIYTLEDNSSSSLLKEVSVYI